MSRQPLWYKDAVIYEVHVGSFYDANGDGVGDFEGLTERLDYIEELGVTALWLLPFYPSPQKDDGYDIADYRDIHPDYGTLSDFKTFLDEAHRRGLKVITELVINHTSDQHPWFRRARRAPEGSSERNYYVWSDSPERYSDARIVFSDVKDSNWSWDREAGAYYWHRFYDHQPDLNFENPDVRDEIFDVLDFWMSMGVDGMRLDAVTYLYEREGTDCESLPETHAFLRDLRAHVDDNYDDRMLLAEANQWPEDAIDYYGDGDECHMAFHFPLMPRLFMAVEMGDRFPLVDIIAQTPSIPDTCQWAVFLRNHDELTLEMVTDEERDFMYRRYAPEMRMRFNLGIRRRLAPLMKNDRRKIELMYGLLFSIIGTPVIYYGDELGMGDNYHLGDRDGVRTPMQWNADQNAGFSDANPQGLHLPIIHDPEYHYVSRNVEAQEDRSSSLLNWLKRLIAVRREHEAFGRGDLTFMEADNHRVAVYQRRYEDDVVLVAMNLSRTAEQVTIEVPEFEGYWPVELVGHTSFPRLDSETWTLTLPPYAFYWFSLEEDPPELDEVVHHGVGASRPMTVQSGWEEVFEGRLRTRLTDELIDYMVEQNWFQVRGQRIQSVEVVETIPVKWEDGNAVMSLVEIRFSNGEMDTYVLPLTARHLGADEAMSAGEEAGRIGTVHCSESGGVYVLYDAVQTPAFSRCLLKWVCKGREIRGQAGELEGICKPSVEKYISQGVGEVEPQVTTAGQTHTTVLFDENVVLKIFRRLDDRVSLDMEMGRYLTDAGFEYAPDLLGHLSYRRGRWEPLTLAIVNTYVPHTETATPGIRRYFDAAAAEDSEVSEDAARPADLPGAAFESEGLMEVSGDGEQRLSSSAGAAELLDLLELVGRRTAQLHALLEDIPEDSNLAPQPFTKSYQRARYQWMRGVASRAFRTLEDQLDGLSEAVRARATELLDCRTGVMEQFKALIGRGIGGKRIRIHGDLHFGQILVTNGDISFIDFEGRPGKPTGERRIQRSALRDLSTLLTSLLELAQHSIRARQPGADAVAGDDGLFEVMHLRLCEASKALVDGYFKEAGGASYLPPQPLAGAVFLDALRLEQGLRLLQEELERQETRVGFLLEQLLALCG